MSDENPDSKLLENILKSLRQADSPGKPATPTTPTSPSSTPSEPKQSTQKTKHVGTHIDGEKTGTPGPCDCGFRHWFEGKEYDYVCAINTTTGPKKFAYNDDDNPYEVAQNFLVKYNINSGSLNDTPYISAIANAILEQTNEKRRKRKTSEEFAEEEEEKIETSFDPYQASWNTPSVGTRYNKVTGQVESIVYPEEQKKIREKLEEEEKRRSLASEDAKKKYQEEKLKREIEQQRIKERIRLDRLEREAKKKEEQERLQAEAALRLQQSKTVMEGGVLKIVRPDSQEDLTSLERVSSTTKTPTKTNFRTLFSEEKEEGREREEERHPSKENWTMEYLLDKYEKYGEERCQRMLRTSGFDEEEIKYLLKVASLWYAKKKMEEIAMLAAREKGGHFGGDEEEEELFSIKEAKEKKFSAFSGAGMSLQDTPPKETKFSPRKEEKVLSVESTKAAENPVEYVLQLDEKAPSTTLQLRLWNGTKLIQKFNLTHTVQDIRSFIESKLSGSQYELMITFPKKVLKDTSQTISAAGLQNAVIIQTKL